MPDEGVACPQSGNGSSQARDISAVVADTATSTSTQPRIQQELLARYKPLASEVESTEVDASDGSAMTRGQHPRPGTGFGNTAHRGPLMAASPMHRTRRVSLLSYEGFRFQISPGATARRSPCNQAMTLMPGPAMRPCCRT